MAFNSNFQDAIISPADVGDLFSKKQAYINAQAALDAATAALQPLVTARDAAAAALNNSADKIVSDVSNNYKP